MASFASDLIDSEVSKTHSDCISRDSFITHSSLQCMNVMGSLSEVTGSVGEAELAHSNIFCRPVPPGWDEARLAQFFSAFGAIDSVRISHPAPGTRSGVAHAFIRFKEPESAQASLNALQGAVLDGVAVTVKLADADMAPKIQSGLCSSEWCYARGLPAHLTKDDIAAIFAAYGPMKEIKQ